MKQTFLLTVLAVLACTNFILGVVLIKVLLSIKKNKAETLLKLQEHLTSFFETLKIKENLTKVSLHAEEVKEKLDKFERLLYLPQERGHFGELSLELILKNTLPKGYFGIREKVLDGKVPDAYIKVEDKILCIDSKFPLRNYWNLLEAKNEDEKEHFKKAFLKDVKLHLEKVARDYIAPEKGTLKTALVYIPSEAVYYFLLKDGFDVLLEFAKLGVQVVSPVTLTYGLELVKNFYKEKELEEEVKEVKNRLLELSKDFEKLDSLWKTFYSTHLRNAATKAEELNQAYAKLKNDFSKLLS